jgi:hypothetical protein
MGRAKRVRTVVLGASVAALGATGACPAANAAGSEAPHKGAARVAVARGHAKHRRRHARRRHATHPAKPPTAVPHGEYVYESVVGDAEASENEPNMECTGAGHPAPPGAAGGGATLVDTSVEAATFTGPNVEGMERRDPDMFNHTYTLTLGPATTITVNWLAPDLRREAIEESERHNGEVLNPRLDSQEDTATVGSVCAAATLPHAFVAEVGKAVAKWVLPAPVATLAALAQTPPANIALSEDRVAFEVPPDGTVPPFSENVGCLTTGKTVGNKEECNERERAEAVAADQ